MIIPMIHRWLQRKDVALLVAQIAEADPVAARRAASALEAGDIDLVLDSPMALDVVRGRGGAPAPLPLTLLWYIPVRATLRQRGEGDIDIADFTATLPVTFASSKALRRLGVGDPAITTWVESISSLPSGTVVRAERAVYCAAVALWWAGCFPERIERVGGKGTYRAYADFASAALDQAADILKRNAPDEAALYARAGARVSVLLEALLETRADYLGAAAHSPARRLRRYLANLGGDAE